MKNLIVCLVALVLGVFLLALPIDEAKSAPGGSNKPTFITYVLTAIAYDAAGNSASSAPVEVKVKTQ